MTGGIGVTSKSYFGDEVKFNAQVTTNAGLTVSGETRLQGKTTVTSMLTVQDQATFTSPVILSGITETEDDSFNCVRINAFDNKLYHSSCSSGGSGGGAMTATTLEVADAATFASTLDTKEAAAMVIAGTTATSVDLSKLDAQTNVKGSLTVDQKFTASGDVSATVALCVHRRVLDMWWCTCLL